MDTLVLIPGAFFAGLLMFLAPCTLPIIPGYLIFIAGTPASSGEWSKATRKKRILTNALAFVLGFSAVFICLGLFAGGIGSILGTSRDVISRLAGLIIILFGLMMLNIIHLPIVGGEWHAKVPKFLSIGRWESSLLIGALFALGWSPCIGPILGTILLFASTSATAIQGGFLLAIFSMGLGVPFLLTALLIDSASFTFTKWARLAQTLSTIGGVLLVCIGVLILLGWVGVATQWCAQLFGMLGYDRLYRFL